MKSLAIAAVLAACGPAVPHGPTTGGADPDDIATRLPVTRWFPSQPTYGFVAPTLRDGQAAVAHLADLVGPVFDASAAMVSAGMREQFGVDPLDQNQLAGLGFDLDGNIAVFSDELAPTFAVHLSAPEAMRAFIAKAIGAGMVASTAKVGDLVVSTYAFSFGDSISWVIDHDWLLVHVGQGPPSTAWFTAIHDPHSRDWQRRDPLTGGDTFYAGKDATATVGGFVDLPRLLGIIAHEWPGAAACTKRLGAFGHVEIGSGVRNGAVGFKLSAALDPAAAAAAVAHGVLAPPPGWQAVAADAPIALQWNLDLDAGVGWFEPCAKALHVDPIALSRYQVRTLRAALETFSDGKPSGVLAADLSGSSAIASMLAEELDRIPSFLRSRVDHAKRFGTYSGHELSIPTVPTVDYVLTDALAIFAIGDGLIDRVVATSAQVSAPPAASLVIQPRKLSPAAWKDMFDAIGLQLPEPLLALLQHWQRLSVTATVGNDGLKLQAEAAP